MKAINLLFYIHNKFLNRHDQQYVVFHFFQLITIVYYFVFQTKKNLEAVLKNLKQKREVILRFFMNDRNNISKLKIIHSKLYVIRKSSFEDE